MIDDLKMKRVNPKLYVDAGMMIDWIDDRKMCSIKSKHSGTSSHCDEKTLFKQQIGYTCGNDQKQLWSGTFMEGNCWMWDL